MKIGGTGRKRSGYQASTLKKPGTVEGADSPFKAILDKLDRESPGNQEAPGFESVDAAAKALKASPTMRNLRAYREAVRAFLDGILKHAYEVEEIRGFNRKGKRTISVLVRIVDEKLDQLAKLVLSDTQDALAIAAAVDDIRGILLDLHR